MIPKSVIHRAIEEARKQKNRDERAADRRYEFAAPDVASSEDFIEVRQGGKVLRIQDDFARIAFGGEHRLDWTGADVSRFLDAAFRRYGKPLFFKHDLGGEFKDGIFQAFLRGNRVIAFPSPPYSPWYNGKMEYLGYKFRNLSIVEDSARSFAICAYPCGQISQSQPIYIVDQRKILYVKNHGTSTPPERFPTESELADWTLLERW